MSDNRTPIDDGGFSWRRCALCLKETRQILRDPSSGLIAFVIPLMLLFIFGYGISGLQQAASGHSDGAAERRRARSGPGVRRLALYRTNHQRQPPTADPADAGRHDPRPGGDPVDFDQRMARPHDSAPIQIITDGSEPNTANFVQGYARGVWQIGSSSAPIGEQRQTAD